MSRRDGLDSGESLGKIIDLYKSWKDEEKILKKDIAEVNDKIKTSMKLLGEDNYVSESGQWVVKLTAVPNESLDEVRAIEILKKNLDPETLSKVVKVKEYIDDDALESLVYSGDFDINLIKSCTIQGEPTYKLTVSKNKNKGE